MQKHVLVILADGFEEIEAIAPIDLLRRAGLDVTVAGLDKTVIKGAHGITITCDTTVGEIHLRPYDAVVLPGGLPGTNNLLNSDLTLEIVSRCYRDNCVVAAICAAPRILDKVGALHNKPFTCYPGVENEISHGSFTDQNIVISDNVITGKSAGTSIEFALAIIDKLVSKEIANQVQDRIVF